MDYEPVSGTVPSIKLTRRFNAEEHRLWHILLTNAYPEFKVRNEHSISIERLLQAWNPKKDRNQLSWAIDKLIVHVEFQAFTGKKKIASGIFALLSSISLLDTMCTYYYSPRFKNIEQLPELYKHLSKENLTYKPFLDPVSISQEQTALAYF